MEFSFATNNGPLFISNDQNCSLSICNKKKNYLKSIQIVMIKTTNVKKKVANSNVENF